MLVILFVLLYLLMINNEMKITNKLIDAFKIDLNRNRMSVRNMGMNKKKISNAFKKLNKWKSDATKPTNSDMSAI